MDPTTSLYEIRDAYRAILADDIGPAELSVHAADLAEHVKALDEWMSRGGFLPAQWNDPRVRQS